MNPTRARRRNASAGGKFRKTLKEKGYRLVIIIAFLLGRFFGVSRLVPRSLSMSKGTRSKTAFAEKNQAERITDYKKSKLNFSSVLWNDLLVRFLLNRT